jgi:hypothetical protein
VKIVAILLLGIPTLLSKLLVSHYGLLRGIALTFVVYHTTLLFSIVLYRTSPAHPLARYPGPLSAKITRIYWAWIAVEGHQHRRLAEMHEQYGDIVRIGECSAPLQTLPQILIAP